MRSPLLSILPGWESVEITSAYARWFTYAGFAALFLLGAFEILGHIYSVHETALKDAANARREDNRRAESDARLAEAEARVATEQLERIKLEARVAPRSFDLDQQRKITDALRRFSGHEQVTVSSYSLDGEGAALGAQLISVLEAAGIPVRDARAQDLITGGFETGVRIRGPATENNFMSALSAALSSIGHLQVAINGPGLRSSFENKGGIVTMGGNAAIIGGMASIVDIPVPTSGPVSIMVGIKPVPVLR